MEAQRGWELGVGYMGRIALHVIAILSVQIISKDPFEVASSYLRLVLPKPVDS